MRTLLCLILAAASGFAADIVPSGAVYSAWATAGANNGTRPDSSLMAIHASFTPTGDTTDRLAAIQAAINACPSNQVVSLAAGDYTLSGMLQLSNDKGVVLKGEGGYAVLKFTHNGAAIQVGNGGLDWPFSRTGTTLSADEAAGQTEISVSSTASFSVGDQVRFAQAQNRDPLYLVVRGSSTNTYMQTFQSRVTAVGVGTITIRDPLPVAFTTALNAQVKDISAAGFAQMCGLENLTIDCTTGLTDVGVRIWNAEDCWLYNVKILEPDSQGIYFIEATHCTVERCWLEGPGSGGTNGAGLLFGTEGSIEPAGSLHLIIHNVIFDFFPGIEMCLGLAGSVFAYNVIERTSSVGAFGAAFNHHGAHPNMNLIEHNFASQFEQDGFFGSASHVLVANNRFTGSIGKDQPFVGHDSTCSAIELNRFTRQFIVVGNYLGMSQTFWSLDGRTLNYELNTTASQPRIYRLGFPFLGNNAFTGTAEPSTGDWWDEWAGGVPAAFTASTQMDERDLDVENTLTRKGNFNFYDNAIPASEDLAGATIANSYYLSSAPEFYGKTYPPNWGADGADSVADMEADMMRLPAGEWYLTGTFPGDGGEEPPPTSGGGAVRATRANAGTIRKP
jgi:hypothetical protein